MPVAAALRPFELIPLLLSVFSAFTPSLPTCFHGIVLHLIGSIVLIYPAVTPALLFASARANAGS